MAGVVRKSHQGQKLFSFFALLFFAMMFLKLVMDVGDHKGGKEDNQDNVGNEEEVDNEELDNEEKVDTMGRRRTMRRWSTRSPRKNHLFFNMFLYS